MTLQLYIFRQLATGLIFAIGGMAFVAIPGIAVNAAQRLGGVGAEALVGYLPLVALGLVPYLGPIGFLLAVVATYGRLAADNEWTAMAMARIHPLRLIIPPLLLAGLFGGGTYYLLANVNPNLLYAQRAYMKGSVMRAFRNLSPGRTELRIGPFYLSSRFRVGEVFHDAVIHIPGSDDGDDTTVLADDVRITIEDSKLWIVMHNARTVKGNLDVKSENPTVRLDLDQLFKVPERQQRRPIYKSTELLLEELASGELETRWERRSRYEVHGRYALAASYLAFLLVGVPTGLLLRKGTQLGALASAVGYALVYYTLSLRLGRDVADLVSLPPETGAWLGDGIALIAGVWLSLKALRR